MTDGRLKTSETRLLQGIPVQTYDPLFSIFLLWAWGGGGVGFKRAPDVLQQQMVIMVKDCKKTKINVQVK